MLRIPAATLLLALLPAAAVAQTGRIHGRLVDAATHAPVAGGYVRLVRLADTTDTRATQSGDDGAFAATGLAIGLWRLDASRIGYRPLRRTITLAGAGADADAGTLELDADAVPQPGITVRGQAPAAVAKADTTEFNPQAVQTHKDATAEELVQKLPGVVIDQGQVKSNGEQVRQVLVDGRPFFGGDPMVALRNLPADVIDKVQVYDKASDQSEFTGFDDGQSTRTMNIALRKDRRARFGKASAGGGDQGHYLASLNGTMVRGPQRVTVLGLANDVNQQNFSPQDLLGVLGGGAGGARGGGAGEGRRFGAGGGFGGGGAGGGRGGGTFTMRPGGDFSSFFVGPQDGLVRVASLGSNWTGQAAPKLQGNGSWFSNRTDTRNTQLLDRTYVPPLDSITGYGQTSRSSARNDNHRLDAKLEWTPDTTNSFVFQPRAYFQRNHAVTSQAGGTTALDGGTPSTAVTSADQTTTGNNVSLHVTARHKFATRGRTLSLDATGGGTERDAPARLASLSAYPASGAPGDTLDQRTDAHTTTRSFSGRAVATNPLGAHALLQAFYAPSVTSSRSASDGFGRDLATGFYTVPDASLANTLENTSVAHNTGLGVLIRRGQLNLMASMAYQYSTLRSDRIAPVRPAIDHAFDDVLPSLMLNWTGKNRDNLRLSLNTSTRPPSITQLQDVPDRSNPLIVTTGNPSLKQSQVRNFVARWSHSDPATSRSLFAVLSVTQTDRTIANATVTAPRDTLIDGIALGPGVQLVRPVNRNGAWNATTFATTSRPLGWLHSVLNLSGGVTYARTPGVTAGVESIAETWALNPGAVLASNISPDVDFTLSWNGTWNVAGNSRAASGTGDYYSHTLGLRLNLTLPGGVVLRDEVNHALTDGVSAGYDQNVVLWNSSIAKKFLRDGRGELKLSGSDVLAQNRATRRSVTESYVQDVRNRALGRYVMLTFTYTLAPPNAFGR